MIPCIVSPAQVVWALSDVVAGKAYSALITGVTEGAVGESLIEYHLDKSS